MGIRCLGVLASILIFVGGCATGPIFGGAGQVSGSLRSIEIFTRRPEAGELYRTAAREKVFGSDRSVYVASEWALPGSGDYVSKIALRTPNGSIHRESVYRFRSEGSSWLTLQPVELPQGDSAQPLAGRWEVEVSLDDAPVGRRAFTFDPGSVRLRTKAQLAIVHGRQDHELATGDWTWTSSRYGVLEHVKAAMSILGVVLRDELARRFPDVKALAAGSDVGDATVLLTAHLGVSPNPDIYSRLDLEVVHLPTNAARKFQFKSRAGYEQRGMGGARHFGIDATDLAFQAASNRELLEFLVGVTQAVPE
jgi:hypothetical protein